MEELIRQLMAGNVRFDGANDDGAGGGGEGGGEGEPAPGSPTVEEEEAGGGELSLEEFTERRLAAKEKGEEPGAGGEEPKKKESDDEPGTGEESDDPNAGKGDPEPKKKEAETDDGDGADETKGEEGSDDDTDGEGDFYDPEKYKETAGIDRDIPHTNKFKDKESAEYAAINKASILKETLEKLKELGTDHGAIQLPAALNGSLENLDDLESLENVANMPAEDLQKFLWESDEFRHRIQKKAESVKQQQESQKTTQEFEEAQQALYDGVSDLLGGEDKLTKEVAAALDKGPAQGKKFLREKIDAKVEADLTDDVKALEKWTESDEAADLSRADFAKEYDRRKNALAEKKTALEEKYGQVVETYEKAFELAPKVKEAKPKTDAELVTQAYSSLDVWQKDQEGYSNLLIDDPGAKVELKAFVKNAMLNKDKFNNLQHPSDWNRAEKWWNEEFKPSVRGKQQKEQLDGKKGGKKTPAKQEKKDGIQEPDPNKQDEIKSDPKDVYSINQSNLDSLVEETDAA